MVWRQDVSDLIALNIVDSGFTTKMARSVDVEGSNGEVWVPRTSGYDRRLPSDGPGFNSRRTQTLFNGGE